MLQETFERWWANVLNPKASEIILSDVPENPEFVKSPKDPEAPGNFSCFATLVDRSVGMWGGQEIYNFAMMEYRRPDAAKRMVYWSDGSSRKSRHDRLWYGAGACARQDPYDQEKWLLLAEPVQQNNGSSRSSQAAEMRGFRLAIEDALNSLRFDQEWGSGIQQDHKVVIYTDHRDLLAALSNFREQPAGPDGIWAQDCYRAIQAARSIHAMGVEIQCHLVIAHQGVPGNEAADRAAAHCAERSMPKLPRCHEPLFPATDESLPDEWADFQ